MLKEQKDQFKMFPVTDTKLTKYFTFWMFTEKLIDVLQLKIKLFGYQLLNGQCL